MSLSSVAYQIATDPIFKAQMQENSEKALSDRGISLSALEMEILQDMQLSKISRLLTPGDDPITRYAWGIEVLESGTI